MYKKEYHKYIVAYSYFQNCINVIMNCFEFTHTRAEAKKFVDEIKNIKLFKLHGIFRIRDKNEQKTKKGI